MTILTVLVDFDNVEAVHRRPGPVSLSRMLISLLPPSLVGRHTAVAVRLYGGWRVNNVRTRLAQTLVPDIQSNSPCIILTSQSGRTSSVRMSVELADGPIASRTILEGTFAQDRSLRKFSVRKSWAECANPAACGMAQFQSVSHATSCSLNSCGSKLSDVLIRDEQKMVDTLMVADMAHQAFLGNAKDIVLVSSDTDLWPGVLLSLRAGCGVIQVHTRPGGRTQNRLLNTLVGPMKNNYLQLSV